MSLSGPYGECEYDWHMMMYKVNDLRAEWKPTADTDALFPEFDPIRIRLHRCWSWLQRVEDLEDAGYGAQDARLIYSWIAFNSLYGIWDSETREPKSERQSFTLFVRRVIEFDQAGQIPEFLEQGRDLAKAIVGDEFLSNHFWDDPNEGTARKAQSKSRQLPGMYLENRYASISDLVLQRVYLARCQLVHGAATHGSKLNRTAVGRCGDFLFPFVYITSRIIVREAWREDWGDLCYPPIDASR